MTDARNAFDAMCAMRNSINEFIPMPSLESDLLQGPEVSVLCATVAEAVIAEVRRLRAASLTEVRALPEVSVALSLVKRMIDEALPRFDWGASFLDANAIQLLNEAPLAVNAALRAIGGRAE